MIRKELFGNYDQYVLFNDELEVAVTTFGAMVTRLKYKGTERAVCYSTPEEENQAANAFLCKTIGRYANRIGSASFTLDGVKYVLPANEGVNQLHGGPEAFDRRIWNAEVQGDSVQFSLFSPDGDNGFPGNFIMTVRYSLRGSAVRIDFGGATDKATVYAPTVHHYFNLNDVTLIGISLGGYLAPRAAAYDDRIQRVVMYDLIYDFYGAITHKMGEKKARLFDYMTAHPKNILWKWLNKKLDENYFTRWLLGQGYAIYENVHTPCEYFNCIKQYNTREISPLLKQDVLVLAGTDDLYTIYYEEQLKALTNARSVTGRLFTREECAAHHCQIGNVQLVLDTIENWIREKTDGKKTNS